MGLATFITKALVLSINVTLRMFVMLAVSAFGIYMLFAFLWEHPFGIFFVLALTFFPGLVFLYLSCVRAGLVALKASGPPNLKKLGTATIRMFRFNVMINNLIITLFGIGGSVLIMVYLTPTIWADLSQEFEFADLADLGELAERILQMPIAVVLMLTLAISISTGVIGASSAAVAASAAEVGPSHHPLWGITRQFFPLFVLSLLILVVPISILALSKGGFLTPIYAFGEMGFTFYALIPVYAVWAGCALCGGKALAYVQTVKDMEYEWVKERDDMLGDIVPQDIELGRSLEAEAETSSVAPESKADLSEFDDNFVQQTEEEFRRAVEERMAQAQSAKSEPRPKRKTSRLSRIKSRLSNPKK